MVLLYGHAGLMATGLALMLAGVLIARFMKRRPWWLACHRTAGMTGALCAAAGFLTALAMAGQAAGGHPPQLHAGLGLTTLSLALAAPIGGILQFKFQKQAPAIRFLHRWSGRAVLMIGTAALASGLLISGII